MKIVITGALGHIGSKIIKELPLCFPGSELVLIDNLATQRYCSLFNLTSEVNYRFFEVDVLETHLFPIIEGARVVIHLAALTNATSSFKMKKQVEQVNYNTTVKIANTCSQTNTPMIHLSSTSVYGTQNDVVDENCSKEELQPQSPYAETKLKEEEYLENLGFSDKLNFVTCRFGTITGTSPGMRFHTAINKFCWQAVMGQPVTVWRTALNQKRPYLTLTDAVKAIQFIIQENLFDKNIYNILTENLTVNSILELIRLRIPELEIVYVDTEIMNQLSYEVSNLRFKKKGFEFHGNVKESIFETIKLLKNVG